MHELTGGSAFAVGTAAAIARFEWLFPQLFVAYYAQRRRRRLPFYVVGAFGREACLVALAAVVWTATQPADLRTIALFFAIWTLYAFVSGIVAVPYNDIVARSIPSDWHSRMLALRFFGGGLLALAVAAAAHRVFVALPFASAYAMVLLLGAALLFISGGSNYSWIHRVRSVFKASRLDMSRQKKALASPSSTLEADGLAEAEEPGVRQVA